MLLDRNCIKYVLYHTYIIRFDLLSDVFLTQLGYICSRHQEDCSTICQLLENPVFYLVYLMLLKNQRFENYIVKYSRKKVIKEIDMLISSLLLQE